MNETYAVLGSATAVAGIIVAVTRMVRDAFPHALTTSRTVLFTMALGPVLMAAAWAMQFTPPGMDWRSAAVLGFNAAMLANGLYSGGKALIEHHTPAAKAKPSRSADKGLDY